MSLVQLMSSLSVSVDVFTDESPLQLTPLLLVVVDIFDVGCS